MSGTQKKSKKPGVEDWRWAAFWKGELYGNNKTHKEARCREEVALELAKRKEAQMEKIRQGLCGLGKLCLIANFMSKAVKPICGKIKNLSKHIRECESVRAQWKTKLAAEENGESDSDDIASPETSTAVGQKNKRQATFELVPGAKRFKKDGRTYSDKTRNLLNPERAHKSLIVQRDLIDNFPSTKRRRRRHIPFVQLRADVKSGAENIIPDDEEEPANGNITELTRHLDELPEDGDAGDDTFPEPEIAQAIQQPSIRLHFGTEELYELHKIFTEDSFNSTSTWGGSLLSYQVDGTSDLNDIAADFEEDGRGTMGPMKLS
ncbi:hypothetical protein B0H10DRAFT_2230730 [Mycena sp. CBHHK59/15]|nr:hypothetical protein B0H10DRAFT_2230730 [Mycena sp. CBHHK59/15]